MGKVPGPSPYVLAIFTAAVLIVRFYGRFSPRQIGALGFVVVSAGLALLAFAIHNDWGTPLVIASVVILGLGEGALLTLLFNGPNSALRRKRCWPPTASATRR